MNEAPARSTEPDIPWEAASPQILMGWLEFPRDRTGDERNLGVGAVNRRNKEMASIGLHIDLYVKLLSE